MITLGADPERMTVHLSRDSDFNAVLESYSGPTPADYPVGTAVTLEVETSAGTTTWTATVAANTATFTVDEVAVNTLLDTTGPKEARLFYENGTDRRLWAFGPVREH